MSTPLTDEQLAEIKARAETTNPVLLSHDDAATQIISVDVPALLAEVERLKQEEAFHWGIRMDVEKVLDEALGAEVEDGAGAGLVADVALLADRKSAAETVGRRQAELLDRVGAQLARWRHIDNRREAAAEMQAELDREVVL